MVTSKKKNVIEVDLDGEDGNAFYLLALAKRLCIKSGIKSDSLIEEMKSKDYNHLLKTLNDAFGQLILFRTNNPEYLKLLK